MRWPNVKLDLLCEMNSGGTPRRGVPGYYEGNIPWVKIGDIDNATAGVITKTEELITSEGLRSIRGRLFPKGTLLLAMYGSVGKTAFAGVSLSTNQAILGIRIKDRNKLYDKYLKFWLDSIKQKLLNRAVGGTLQNISLGIVKQLEIPLPPVSIQKQIADILDKADALRMNDDELLQNYDELSKSIFFEMFGIPAENTRGWDTFVLKSVCNEITDGTHFSPPNVSDGIPYITAKHVKRYGVDFELDPTFVSLEDHKKIYARCKPEKGDILYIKDGATTGIAAINHYDFEFSMLSSLALIKPNKEKLNSYYLKYWLNSDSVKDMYIREFMAGAAIKRFTLQKINQFKVNLPPIELQNEFEKKVILVESLRKKQVEGISNSKNLFQLLLKQYFR